MRKGHFIVLYFIILLVLFGNALLSKYSSQYALREKDRVDSALQLAVDTAAEQMADYYQNANMGDYLTLASDTFFQGLAAGLGLYENMEEREELTFFVPALLMTSTEGFYINYLAQVEENGLNVLKRLWTECIPYTYSDEYFTYRFFLDDSIMIYEKSTGDILQSTLKDVMSSPGVLSVLSDGEVFLSEDSYYQYKRHALAESIRTNLGRVTSQHSYIAGQFDITIVYELPSFFEDFTPATEYPSLYALFQGYPLSDLNGILYNNVSSSAAYIMALERYVVEVSNSLGQPFSLYHKKGCAAIGSYGMVLDGTYSMEKSIHEYGAYACPQCFSDDDRVAKLP